MTQPDPITVLRIHLAADPPGLDRYYLAPRTLATRLSTDAQGSGDQVDDLGPSALLYTKAAKPAEFHSGANRFMVLVGIARDGHWQLWTPPAPIEPVPGSRDERAQRN